MGALSESFFQDGVAQQQQAALAPMLAFFFSASDRADEIHSAPAASDFEGPAASLSAARAVRH